MNISVIIPVYNAERFLEKAVGSTLQFSEVKEVLLIEDQSPDNSLDICKKLAEKDTRVKVFQHPDKGNHGAGTTRNLGLEKASSEFIAFLDADDYYLPNRFDAEKEIFKNEKIEGIFNAIGTDFLTEQGKEDFQRKFKNVGLTTVKHHAEGIEVFYGILGLDKSFGTFFHLNGLTVRTSSLKNSGLRFNEKLRVHQDQDFITKLAFHLNLKSGNITEAVAMRGVHDDNRITKIQLYSADYKQRQKLLWNSIFEWSKNKSIKKKYKEHINLQHKTYEISQSKGILKFLKIAESVLSNPKILKTRYRFLWR